MFCFTVIYIISHHSSSTPLLFTETLAEGFTEKGAAGVEKYKNSGLRRNEVIAQFLKSSSVNMYRLTSY